MVGAGLTPGHDILKLLGLPGHVVDDGVHHDLVRGGELGDVLPGTQTRIHLAVVDGVEPRIGTVKGSEEGEDVDTRIDTLEPGPQHLGH